MHKSKKKRKKNNKNKKTYNNKQKKKYGFVSLAEVSLLTPSCPLFMMHNQNDFQVERRTVSDHSRDLACCLSLSLPQLITDSSFPDHIMQRSTSPPLLSLSLSVFLRFFPPFPVGRPLIQSVPSLHSTDSGSTFKHYTSKADDRSQQVCTEAEPQLPPRPQHEVQSLPGRALIEKKLQCSCNTVPVMTRRKQLFLSGSTVITV